MIGQMNAVWRNHLKEARLGLAAVLIMLAWTMQKAGWAPGIANGAMLGAVALVLPGIAKEAWGRLLVKQASIPLLVTVAAVGSVVIGETWEAAAVSFLYVLGGYLESITLARTRNALRSLVDMTPRVARVMQNGELVTIPAHQVTAGMVVVVLPGDKVPVDGVAQSGRAVLDTSVITGEPLPVEVEPGMRVMGGSVSSSGYMEIVAERVGADTTFSRLLYMVAAAQEQKPRVQRFLDRFARWYTPAAIGAALLVAVFTRDIRLALTFLVIACPGALVMAAPVAVVAGIGQAAKHGVLIKGGERLERIARVDVVAFDKTGTLTLGKPEVVDVRAFGASESEILALAAGAEQRSEHHLAAAIQKSAQDRSVTPATMDNWQLQPGLGVTARLAGTEVLVGNQRLLAAHGVSLTAEQESVIERMTLQGYSVAIVAHGDVRGILGIADRLRPDAKDTVAALQKAGLDVTMLTGDNAKAAGVIARQVGITNVQAGLMPEDKVAIVQQLQHDGHTVAMVGDGVNDAPALAVADVSVAMGMSGTQAAADVADLVLMSDTLAKLPGAVGFSRRILAVVRQNVAFAVAVVFLLLAGVLGRVVFLSSGMLIHELSVLLVIANGMRLLRTDHFSRNRVSASDVVYPMQRVRLHDALCAEGSERYGVGCRTGN